MHRLSCTALVLLALSASADATSVTTNNYTALSLDEDIATSCKAVSIATTRVVSASCNALVDGQFLVKATTIDMWGHTLCEAQSDGKVRLAWGTANDVSEPGFIMHNLEIKLDSAGDDYIMEADCEHVEKQDQSTTDQTLDLGDTTKGLKNTGSTGGGLAKR